MKYSALYDGVNLFEKWYKQYYVIFLFRRILFVLIVYYLSKPSLTVLQIFLNLVMTQLFVSYIMHA